MVLWCVLVSYCTRCFLKMCTDFSSVSFSVCLRGSNLWSRTQPLQRFTRECLLVLALVHTHARSRLRPSSRAASDAKNSKLSSTDLS